MIVNLLSYVHLRNIYRSTGVGRVARELTEQMALRPDVRLKVLADREDHARVIEKVGGPWPGFDYRFMERPTSRQQAVWFLRNAPVAESYWPECEVVYCTAESYVPVRRAKLAVACHDMQLFEPGAHAMSRWLLQQRAKWWLLFRRLAAKADMFHAISEFSAERMAHFFPAVRDRLRVVPNAVSESFFLPPTAAGRKLLGELGVADRPYVLVPGGLHHRKNAEVILKAWPLIQERMPELRLVIASHNSPEYIPQAEVLAPSLVLAGLQEEQGIVALYHGAQAVWFPSRYEGFGMPVLEAMATGAPLVTSNVSAIPEVAGGAAAALVDPNRPGDHVEAIVGLLNDSGAQARARALGRARAAEFRWSRSAGMLVEAFRGLL